MKRLLLMLLFISGSYFVKAQQVEVGADKSFSANISDYKTYAWSTDIDKIPSDKIFIGPNGVLVFNNESAREKIKEAIQYELTSRGYKMQSGNADMIVTFMVLEQPGTLQTYNGYKMLYNGLDSTRTPGNIEKVSVEAGTLLINLIDAKSGKVAWQGYASGILKADMINDQAQVREAVRRIFDQFKFKASA